MPNRHIVLSTRDRDGVLVFEVSDDGIGIDYDIQKKVFTSFVSTKEVAKGTGLGLAICREIISLHEGNIELVADHQPGAAFRLRLPHRAL